MKTLFYKNICRMISLLLVLTFTLIPISAAAPVSPGLDILAKNVEMVKSGLLYSDITFTAKDFEKALGVKEIGSITVTSLPEAAEGTLKLNNKNVTEGDVISRKNISALKFVPASSEIRESEFSFSTNHGEHSIVCTLYVLSSVNFAPTTTLADMTSLSLETSKGVSYFGTLSAYDPENDPLVYEIISMPKNGSLSLLDNTRGEYRYTPGASYTGKDSFSYTVRDRYGNYSETATVNIKVKKNVGMPTLADMSGHWAEGAALEAVEKGMMDSKVVGGQSYFYPDKEVSRVEFLTMIMKARGITNLAECSATIFTDDEDIPSEYKGYVAEALERGYVHGSYTSSGIFFKPNDTITRAEAAVIINNIIDAKIPTVLPVFSDINDVPAWAKGALYSLSSLGIFNGTGGGNISAMETINRAQTAKIIKSLSDIK